jgi:hypothetical protein
MEEDRLLGRDMLNAKVDALHVASKHDDDEDGRDLPDVSYTSYGRKSSGLFAAETSRSSRGEGISGYTGRRSRPASRNADDWRHPLMSRSASGDRSALGAGGRDAASHWPRRREQGVGRSRSPASSLTPGHLTPLSRSKINHAAGDSSVLPFRTVERSGAQNRYSARAAGASMEATSGYNGNTKERKGLVQEEMASRMTEPAKTWAPGAAWRTEDAKDTHSGGTTLPKVFGGPGSQAEVFSKSGLSPVKSVQSRLSKAK